ncbi:Rrf2 family transcriptional regulator [bacterium]|nr:Rrf2 family transcriptional regulator [bacterium]
MHLTQYTDHALRLLLYVASFPDRLVTTREVCDAYGVSVNHMVKVVNELGHAGYLDLQRGRAGGIQLARPASAIRIGDVVRLMEGEVILVECFDAENNKCVITPACKLKGTLFRARKAFFDVLDAMTLAECVEGGGLTRFYPPPPVRNSRSSKELRKLDAADLIPDSTAEYP